MANVSRRQGYFGRLTALIEKHPTILIVHADHVGSRQMAEIRLALRGKATVLMGKNTMIRTALKNLTEKMPQLENLIPEVKENIGFVFCEADASDVRKIIQENRRPAAARQGLIAPVDVKVPPGPTGADPTQTNFFQALGIATKIVKGQIEIQSEVHLIHVGDKVTASQSTLLQKLNIRPFAYGLEPKKVYDDGAVYDAAVLDMTDEDIVKKFSNGVQNVAALSRAINFPTEASAVHGVVEAFKHAASLCIASGDFTFPQMEKIAALLADA